MSSSPSARRLATARPANRVHLVKDAHRLNGTEPVPVAEELERFMTELGRLVADLWFEGKFDAGLPPADISQSDD